MNSTKKLTVLTFINNYLPGYKAGGMPRSLINAVDNLKEDIDFRIVTKDRDFGDKIPYENITPCNWMKVGNALVFYLPPKNRTYKYLKNLIETTKYDVLYLNSYFDSFAVKILIIRRFSNLQFKPVIVAPRGVFSPASLKLKYSKKIVFIYFAKLIGLYKNVFWHASSCIEEQDIVNILNVEKGKIHIALDLPTVYHENSLPIANSNLIPSNDYLRIVFLSRIARVKNLDFALQVLNLVREEVIFDIYGPLEDVKYWKECQNIINLLPSNIKVTYCGILNPNQVVQMFGNYDLFLFPSGGENFGHVISESLIAGTPVLISDKTPWTNLFSKGLGWDLPLENIHSFKVIIENYSFLSLEERNKKRAFIKSQIKDILVNPNVLEANRKLFLNHIN